MRAGFGKGEIFFPEELFPLEGFCGIHDNPHVRVMALECGMEKFAIAAIEIVMIPDSIINNCKRLIQEATGTPEKNIWIHVTHAITTPHEPGPMGPPDKRPPATEEDLMKRVLYSTAIENALQEALDEVKANMTEARFGWGTGTCEANTNRDVETPFGWWIGKKGSVRPSNHKMSIMAIENLGGEALGYFVSYGIKPCAIDNSGMKEGVRLVSSDVCGMACTAAEEVLSAPVMFCMSAAGDQIPAKSSFGDIVDDNGVVQLDDEGVEAGFAYAKEMSELMKASILEIAENITCDQTEAKTGWEKVSFEWEGRKGGPRKIQKTAVNEPDGRMIRFEADIFRLGDAVFLAEKPEVNAQTEAELIEQSCFKHTIMVSMVNGGMKYLPDRWSMEQGTWEAQSSMLMPGAAEKLVEEAVKKFNVLKEA